MKLLSSFDDISSGQKAALAIMVLGMVEATLGAPHLTLLACCGLASYPVLVALRGKPPAILLFALAGIIVLVGAAMLPGAANAQFLQEAEAFFKSTFKGADAATTALFGALRAIYLIYLFVSFVGVYNQVRQDEDWQASARTPVIVIVSITVVDVLTALIVGSGGGGGA